MVPPLRDACHGVGLGNSFGSYVNSLQLLLPETDTRTTMTRTKINDTRTIDKEISFDIALCHDRGFSQRHEKESSVYRRQVPSTAK